MLLPTVWTNLYLFLFYRLKTTKLIIGTFIIFFLGIHNSHVNAGDYTAEQDLHESLYGGRNPQNLYLNIYETNKAEFTDKTLERTAKQSTFGEADIEMLLQGEYTENLKEQCAEVMQSDAQTDFYNCIGILRENYEYEKKLLIFEKTLQGEASASEIWSDGDLSNSFFDLIVDLNIIEMILFEENTYEFPYSDYYDFDSDGGSREDNSSQDPAGEEEPGETDAYVCQDPDAIEFTQAVWGTDFVNISDGQSGEQTNSSSTQNPYVGAQYKFPAGSDDCAGESLYQGLICMDAWPCDDFFCIKISFPPQEAESDRKAISVQEIVSEAIKQLNYLKGHTLTVQKNSNERFVISVGKFFNRPISLDVITQGIPVKFTPKNTAFDDESEGQNILGKLLNRLGEEAGFFPEKNGDYVENYAKRSLNMSTEEDGLQSDTYAQMQKDKREFKKSLQTIRNRWKRAEKTKHTQSSWEELRTNLNTLVLYFEAIEEAIRKLETSGTEILEETGQSCN